MVKPSTFALSTWAARKFSHFGKLRVVGFDEARRFVHFNAKPLRDTVGRHAVSDAIGELFDLIAHRRSDLTQLDAINFGGDRRVKVVPLGKGLAKRLVLGKMGEHPQLDLRVIRRQQYVSRRGDKSAADLPAQLAANRNILQVGRARGQAPGRRRRLLVGRVDAPALGIDQRQQHLAETVLELRHLAVFEQGGDNRMAAGKLLQLGGVGGVAGFDLASLRQGQLVEENALQLQIGVDVELFSGELLNRPLQSRHFLSEVSVEFLEIIAIDENAGVLHAREHLDQRKLQIRRQLPSALGAELRFNNRRDGANRHGGTADILFFVGGKG